MGGSASDSGPMGVERRVRGRQHPATSAHPQHGRRVHRPAKGMAAPEVQNDADLKQTGTKDLADAKAKFEAHLKRAYQHVAYWPSQTQTGTACWTKSHSMTITVLRSTAQSSGRAWRSGTRFRQRPVHGQSTRAQPQRADDWQEHSRTSAPPSTPRRGYRSCTTATAIYNRQSMTRSAQSWSRSSTGQECRWPSPLPPKSTFPAPAYAWRSPKPELDAVARTGSRRSGTPGGDGQSLGGGGVNDPPDRTGGPASRRRHP